MLQKLTLLSTLFFLGVITLSEAATQTINVDLSNSAPIFNRPNVAAGPPGSLSTQTQCKYRVFSFTAPVGGTYTFTSFNSEGTEDPFGALYQFSFVPSSPLTNFLRSNDDYSADPTNKNYAMSRTLTAGVTYYLVSTQFFSDIPNDPIANYDVNITGPFLTPLPVEIVSFDANLLDHRVELTWETASERNCDRFDIQRSLDGTSFETIGQVSSKSIAGSSSEKLSYNFIDVTPGALNYYRLTQVDLDGKLSISEVLKVENPNAGTVFNLYPNPTANNLQLSYFTTKSSKVDIRVMNLTGGVVKRLEVVSGTGNNGNSLSIGDLPNGLYLVQIDLNGKNAETIRVVKQD